MAAGRTSFQFRITKMDLCGDDGDGQSCNLVVGVLTFYGVIFDPIADFEFSNTPCRYAAIDSTKGLQTPGMSYPDGSLTTFPAASIRFKCILTVDPFSPVTSSISDGLFFPATIASMICVVTV